MITAVGYACDRCSLLVDGFGVLSGLVANSLDLATGAIVERSYCYVGGCRDYVIDGMLTHLTPEPSALCTRCGDDLQSRSIATALLAADHYVGAVRFMTFCYAKGCADALLQRGTTLGGTR